MGANIFRRHLIDIPKNCSIYLILSKANFCTVWFLPSKPSGSSGLRSTLYVAAKLISTSDAQVIAFLRLGINRLSKITIARLMQLYTGTKNVGKKQAIGHPK
jgi:hypothetical protein